MNFLLVDRINEWADTWRAARTQIQTRLQKRGKPPLLLSGDFIQVDVNSASDVRNFGNWGTVFTQDLYILCYLISEIFDDIGNLEEFTRLVARQAPVGAKFLFVERRESQWENKSKSWLLILAWPWKNSDILKATWMPMSRCLIWARYLMMWAGNLG